MNIYWENVRWETEDTGTTSATLADNEHNSLTLEHRDGMITFYTDGNPSFDVGAVLDITAICMVLSKTALGQGGVDSAMAAASQGEDTDVHVPEPRQEATHQRDIRSHANW